ncbi:SIMPL domain-containing protein [Roseomonas marmotae]|uniref:SIMPL domain-containing protein n=1 Tax=Roseomonas marmotae TaxID=2768161 RepID=A0ABS3KG02_9PROT|nr:SIMPL domain-containing protein [Roseomonas marmotae]MBO1076380.1 SIMPL domain-containing protein [Roseomonas marmotae]QTI79410.1 SIMPL domain-containing protein [Roseomonas marmotae]
MPRRLALAALVPMLALGTLAALPPHARAQGAAAPVENPAETTLLRLSETGEVTRAPDELRLELRAEARGSEAAAVQAQVNRAMQAALERARAAQGVRASTGNYWTNRDPESRQWTASQTLVLRGAEAAPLLELAGQMQGQGLAMAGMGWNLTREATQAARQEAGKLAIEALRARAAAVAEQLGMEVAGIRLLSLDAPEAPMPRMAMAMAARGPAAAPPPVSAPEDVAITATAQAELVLRRRP